MHSMYSSWSTMETRHQKRNIRQNSLVHYEIGAQTHSEVSSKKECTGQDSQM
jgi:hypothetical protein